MRAVFGIRLIAALTASLLVALVVVSAVVFVWPHQDRVTRSDAVVVLAGGHNRLPKALDLMERGVAPVLLIDSAHRSFFPEANGLCGRRVPFRVVCFDPHPFSTRGEARAVTRLAAANGWHSLVVVTSVYHVTRARLIFRRCFLGRLEAVGAGVSVLDLPRDVASEWGKLIFSLAVSRGC